MDPCSRHIEIVETLDEHEDRIKYLEIRDTATSVQLENLIKRVDKLIETFENFMDCTRKTIVGVMGTTIVVLVGFFVWYIQKL